MQGDISHQKHCLSSKEIRERFLELGIQASAARLAVADFVLNTDDHPTAEDVRSQVEKRMPSVSLATVYNTLKLFVEKGLVATVKDPKSESIRYDCNTRPHFHFFDESSGKMMDLDPQMLRISPNFNQLNADYEIRGIDVTVRGRKKLAKSSEKNNQKPVSKDSKNS